MATQDGLMSESLHSIQKVEGGIRNEDLVGGVVCSQPLQLGFDDGNDIASVHANSANTCCVTPVSPVQPSGGVIKRQEGRKQEGWESQLQWIFTNINGSK